MIMITCKHSYMYNNYTVSTECAVSYQLINAFALNSILDE